SDRQAAEQQWQLATGPACLIHEAALDWRGTLDEAHSESSERGGGLAADCVDPRQAIRGEGDRQRIERAPALVAIEQLSVAEIESEPGALDQHLGKGCNIPETEVEPLAGDRVNRMRRIADERQPLRRDLRRVMEAEREGGAWRQQPHSAK